MAVSTTSHLQSRKLQYNERGLKMKRLFPAVFLLVTTGILAQQQVQFTAPALKVGQTFVRSAAYKMNFDVVLKFAGNTLQEANRDATQTIRKTETILDMNGETITKIKVSYDVIENKMVVTEDGIPQNEKQDRNPVLRQTYIVTAQDGTVKVTDTNGLKPSLEEVDIVSEDYKNLGHTDSFRNFFRAKSVQVGEPLQMPGVLAAGMFTDAAHRRIKVESASFILKELRKNLAVFNTTLRMQWNEDANTSMKLNVSGETLVNIQSSQPVSTNLSGTMRVTGTEQLYNRLVMVDGKGKIALTESLQSK